MILFELVILNACANQEICEAKVMQSHCGPWSRNVTIGYWEGCCMSASSLTGKPRNFELVSMPNVDKV